MTKSKKTSKTRQKFDFRMEPKITTLLPTCFEIIAMHSVCHCSLPVWRRSFLMKGIPRDLFLPCPGSAPGRIWPKNNNTCKGPWVLHPHQVSSKSIKRFWRRNKVYGRRRTPDDGRTDDGRRAMTIAHLRLWLRWVKNANRKTLITYSWLKRLNFLSFLPKLCKTLESDGQEIKISTRMKKFIFG